MAFSIVPSLIAIAVMGRAVGAVTVAVLVVFLLTPASLRGTRRESGQGREDAHLFLFGENVLDLLRLFIGGRLIIEHVDLRPPGDPLEGCVVDHHVNLFKLFSVERNSCLFRHFAQEGLLHHGYHFQHLFRGKPATSRESLFQKPGGKGAVIKIEFLCNFPYLICQSEAGQAIGVVFLGAGRPVIKSVVVFFLGHLFHD